MDDLTLGELNREIQRLREEVRAKVSREVFDAVVREFRDDVGEIKADAKEQKEASRATQRIVLANLLAFIATVVVTILTRIGGG